MVSFPFCRPAERLCDTPTGRKTTASTVWLRPMSSSRLQAPGALLGTEVATPAVWFGTFRTERHPNTVRAPTAISRTVTTKGHVVARNFVEAAEPQLGRNEHRIVIRYRLESGGL